MTSAGKHLRQGKLFASIGLGIILMTFGVIGGWSALAKIDKGVVAPGTVSVETNRKVVQHLEGGIVREILVREGDRVTADQVLARLEPVQAEVNANVIARQMAYAHAREARLIAERDNADAINWSAVEDLELLHSIGNVVADEESQFRERRNSLRGQILIQQSRIDQHRKELEGLEIENKSAHEQVKFIQRELTGLRELHKKQLVASNRVFSMERERARLEGVIGRNVADTARISSTIGEIEEQMRQTRQKFSEEVSISLVEVRQKLVDYAERGRAAADILRRVVVKSTRAGIVQNVKLTTLGQVVRAGEPLMEIVPEDENLIVSAHFSPNDIDTIFIGQTAEVRFPAFHMRTLPFMSGRVETLSADRLSDEHNQPYYLATISINRMNIPAELRPRLRPGMPAEVIAIAGDRTVVEYLIGPLHDAMHRTFLER